MDDERQKITIFCDGSCYWKHPKKLGGFGVYIQWNDKEYFIHKGYEDTTISRMEQRAVLYALKAIKKDIKTKVVIYSDSQYVTESLNKNIKTWIGEGRLDYVENNDLWKAILKEIEDHKKMRLRLIWRRGHQKDLTDPLNFGNAVADKLADYKKHESYKLDKRK